MHTSYEIDIKSNVSLLTIYFWDSLLFTSGCYNFENLHAGCFFLENENVFFFLKMLPNFHLRMSPKEDRRYLFKKREFENPSKQNDIAANQREKNF